MKHSTQSILTDESFRKSWIYWLNLCLTGENVEWKSLVLVNELKAVDLNIALLINGSNNECKKTDGSSNYFILFCFTFLFLFQLSSVLQIRPTNLTTKNCAVVYSAVLIIAAISALYYIPPSKPWPFLYLFSMHDLWSIKAWLQYYEASTSDNMK